MDKRVHLNHPGMKQISGFGLPPITVTQNKKITCDEHSWHIFSFIYPHSSLLLMLVG